MFFPSLSLRALGAFVLLAAPTLADTAAALSPDASSFSSRDSSSIPGPGPPCDPLVNNAQCRYDYIIIGGGTAGLVVAARLSEDPGVTVAVIEAGSSAKGDDRIDIPSNIGTPFGSELDWQVNTVPQIFSNNNQFYWPRGKVLGGCSALNFMVWDRASKTEYDAWEQLGNPGWNWNSISSTLTSKVETVYAPPPDVASKFNIYNNQNPLGHSGPVKASTSAFIPDYALAWVPGHSAIGVNAAPNPLSGVNLGATLGPSSVDPATRARSYSASAYLWPNMDRPNLELFLNSTVTKINFPPGNYKTSGSLKATASGVTFLYGGKNVTISVNKEVVISAGAVNTPQVLELSGIGQPAVMKKFGIPTVVALPGVGENLQDHVYIAAVYQLKPGNVNRDLLNWNATLKSQSLADWHAGKPSLMDTAVTAIGYATLQQLAGTNKATNLINLAKSQTTNAGTNQNAFNIQIDQMSNGGNGVGQIETIMVDGYMGPGSETPNNTYVSLLAAIQHPFSRGTVHITSSNPLKLPAADPQYFEKSWDLEVMLVGLKAVRKLAGTPQFQQYIATEVLPGTAVGADDDVTLRDFIKNYMGSEYHPVGTASMLPLDEGGVVDPTLKVYGTNNVRVADASIIMTHVAAHIQATTYAIGERAAQIIKDAN